MLVGWGRVMKPAVVLGAVVLLMIFLLSLGLTAVCDSETAAPRVQRPTVRSTEVITIESGGKLELETREARAGATVQVTGTEWNGIGPVRFYLLTEEQYRAHAPFPDAISLGEQTVAGNGSLSFEFRLAERYQTLDGELFIIAPGQKLYIAAVQRTERGAHWISRGPLIVSSHK